MDVPMEEKWGKLQKSQLIDIPEDDLIKFMSKQKCMVLMYKFNVLTRIESLYKSKYPNSIYTKEIVKFLYVDKGLKFYKKYYEPREEWFKSQREYLRHFRQQFYLMTTGTAPESRLSEESQTNFTDDFMDNIESVAHSSLISDNTINW